MHIQPSNKQKASNLVVGIEHRTNLRPLSEEEVRFEIDMCIGCDRCMRACPVPMSSMVNIADLNRATISDDIAPHVARFTDECVMCGSCVPVCPVDNHRDLLMLSLKQRLGVSWDGTVDMDRVLNFLPPGRMAKNCQSPSCAVVNTSANMACFLVSSVMSPRGHRQPPCFWRFRNRSCSGWWRSCRQ